MANTQMAKGKDEYGRPASKPLQSTAVAKINRALKTQTTIDGSRIYKPGDLIDYHRPTATKDEHGGWNGPYPVVRNEPEEGQVICNTGSREVAVQYPDARITLYIEALFTMNEGMDNDAMRLVLDYISGLPAGKAPETFGYVSAAPNGGLSAAELRLSPASKRAPKIHLAQQILMRAYFRVGNVVALRLGKIIYKTKEYLYAD